MGQKIKQFMSNNITQRVIYFLGVLLWTFLWYFDDLNEYPNKTLDLAWAIPTLLLLFQIIFNNRIMWSILFVTFTVYLGAGVLGLTYSFLTSGRLTSESTVEYVIFSSLVAFFIWTFYHMKPRHMNNFEHIVH